jgi:hypothetical protein
MRDQFDTRLKLELPLDRQKFVRVARPSPTFRFHFRDLTWSVLSRPEDSYVPLLVPGGVICKTVGNGVSYSTTRCLRARCAP